MDMGMELGNFMLTPPVVIAMVSALVQIVKQIPWIQDNPRWCPTISVLFGLMFGITFGILFSEEPNMGHRIMYGLMYGLSACGLYSFTKQFDKKPKNQGGRNQS